MLAPFAHQAAQLQPCLAELLLSLAAEFRPVDGRDADRGLDRLADRFCRARAETRRFRPVAEPQILAVTAQFRVSCEDDPEALMLDAVLARRRGHPVLLAVLAPEAARRVGVPLAILGSGDICVVGDLRFEPAVLVDPARGAAWPSPSSPPELLRRRCAHEVAFGVLARLAGAYSVRGDVGSAIRAAELRLALPIAEPVRRKVELERDRLKSRLN